MRLICVVNPVVNVHPPHKTPRVSYVNKHGKVRIANATFTQIICCIHIYIYIYVFEFVCYICIEYTCYKKIYWLCQCHTIAIQNPPYASTISCTIKKMCQSTRKCIFTSLPQIAQKTCMSSCLWWDVPISNSLRCLHSILSLFKRTWRGRHFCCCGGAVAVFGMNCIWQMPRWWLQTNQKSSCKTLVLNIF